MPKFTYEQIAKECEELGIKLNESEEEYLKGINETKTSRQQYISFIPKCGHPIKCQYQSIKNNIEKCHYCKGIILSTLHMKMSKMYAIRKVSN